MNELVFAGGRARKDFGSLLPLQSWVIAGQIPELFQSLLDRKEWSHVQVLRIQSGLTADLQVLSTSDLMLLPVEPDSGYEARRRELGVVVIVGSVPCSLVAVSGPPGGRER